MFFDLLEVDEKEKKIVQAALSPFLQMIVALKPSDIHESLDYLNTKEGACQFYLKDLFEKEKDHISSVLKEKGVVKSIKDLVKINPSYQSLLEPALASVFIVDHLETAMTCYKKYPHFIFCNTKG